MRKQPVCPGLLFSRPHSRAQGSLVLCQATPAVTEHSSSPCPARSAGSKAGSSPSPCPGTHGTVMATEWHSPKTRASSSPRCRRAVLAPASSPSGCSMCAGEQQCPEPPGRMLPALERGVQPWGETRMNSRYTAAEPGSSLSRVKPVHTDGVHCTPGQKQAGHLPDHNLSHLAKASFFFFLIYFLCLCLFCSF